MQLDLEKVPDEKKRWNGSASVAPGHYQLRFEKVPDENKRWHYRLVSFVKNQSAAPTPLFLTAIKALHWSSTNLITPLSSMNSPRAIVL